MLQQKIGDLSHLYWIGGSPCAGKSTIAQTLTERYNLHYYQCDFWFEVHQRRAHPDHQPQLSRLAALSCDELWLPPVAEQVTRVQAIYTEEFAMILADLQALPHTKPILAEGAALLPTCVLAHLMERRRAIWMTPTPPFQRFHYAQRPWIHDVVRTCSDPAQAFANWMARDEAYARWINEQAMALGLSLIQVDGQQTIHDLIDYVANRFGLL